MSTTMHNPTRPGFLVLLLEGENVRSAGHFVICREHLSELSAAKIRN